MSENQFFNRQLFRQVCRFEWGLILVCGLTEVLVYLYAPPNATTPDLRASLIFLAILAVLSIMAPIKGSYWDRFCFLLLELLLITGATATGLAPFLFPLYVVVVAQACLLLDRKGMLIICVLDILFSIIFAMFKIHSQNPSIFNEGINLTTVATLVSVAIVYVYVLLVLTILVAMLAQSLQAEKRSRLEAEKLSQTVRHLATELERGRIAREIHDSLGHTLVALNLQLDIARKLQQREPERAVEALQMAKELAGQSLTDVRMAVESIRTQTDFHFTTAVKDLLNNLQQGGQPVEIKLNMAVAELPPAVGYQVFRVLQECLTNVLKHAQATQVDVNIVESADELQLEVRDNGKGFEEQQAGSGFGIRGMQERVESMRGTVSIEALSQGTTVKVGIPLKQPPPSGEKISLKVDCD